MESGKREEEARRMAVRVAGKRQRRVEAKKVDICCSWNVQVWRELLTDTEMLLMVECGDTGS